MEDEVRCLAVRQPFAWAIVAGEKDIENRSQKTPYRGTVFIHASTSKSYVNNLFRETIPKLPAKEFSFGAIIGAADMVDIQPLCEVLESNPWAQGPYCWKFENARIFKKPIPAKGKLNLFRLSPSLAKRAVKAIANSAPPAPDPRDRAWFKAMTDTENKEQHFYTYYNSYYALKDYENCIRVAKQALQNQPDTEWHTDLGLALFMTGDNGQSIEALNTAISNDNMNARAYFIRSFAQQEFGNNVLAKKDMKKAVELNPAYGEEQS